MTKDVFDSKSSMQNNFCQVFEFFNVRLSAHCEGRICYDQFYEYVLKQLPEQNESYCQIVWFHLVISHKVGIKVLIYKQFIILI